MLNVSLNFYNKIKQGLKPTPYAKITTDCGIRVYAKKGLKGMFESGIFYADGSVIADGSIEAGGELVLDTGSRVITFGSYENVLQNINYDPLTALQVKRQQSVQLTLNNSENYFSKIISIEPFLNKTLQYFLGFPEDPQSEHLELLKLIITSERIYPYTKFIINAEED